MIRKWRFVLGGNLGARFRASPDGSVFVELDDSRAQVVIDAIAMQLQAMADEAGKWGAAQVAATTNQAANVPQGQLQGSPLTIQPPSINMGLAGMAGIPGGGGGGAIQQPGIRPPPPPHGMAGQPGLPAAPPVPGAPVLPQPGITQPPPPPNMGPSYIPPHAQAAAAASAPTYAPVRIGPVARIGSAPAAQAAKTQAAAFLPPEVVAAKLRSDLETDAPWVNAEGKPLVGANVPPLPQPGVLAPPPPPVVAPPALLDASGRPVVREERSRAALIAEENVRLRAQLAEANARAIDSSVTAEANARVFGPNVMAEIAKVEETSQDPGDAEVSAEPPAPT